jgi:transcription antitermination factor NusG
MTSWYCLKTAPQKELALAGILKEYGIVTFCPTETRWRRTARHKKVPVSYAMLPRYIFAAGDDPWSILRAHRHRGVQGVVGVAGRPVAIPERAIERLARISGAPIPTRSTPIRRSFAVGDKVEIMAGPLAAQIVEVARINGRTAEVIISMLGGDRPAEIPLECLEAA